MNAVIFELSEDKISHNQCWCCSPVYSQSSVSGEISTIRDRKLARNCVLFSANCRRLQYSLQIETAS